MRALLAGAVCWLAPLGCAPPPSPAPRSAAPSTPSLAAPAAPAIPPAPERDAQPTGSSAADACGPFECWRFDSPADALGKVLAGGPGARSPVESGTVDSHPVAGSPVAGSPVAGSPVDSGPVALGVGEAHALAGTEQVEPTARRFARLLLPELRGRASHLVVELLNPDPRCADATREVRRVQEPVTAPQSQTNQNDYVELGRRARELGIEPFVLSPTCDEFRAIAAAGDAAVDVMLSTIGRVTSRMLRAALAKNHAAGRSALVIGYGGALHNDIQPAPEKAAWSYGPDLSSFTHGRYVELDLVVREFVRDTPAWKALPWYPHFDPARERERWLVMRTAPSRYALFFPDSGVAASPSELPAAR